MIYSHRLFLLVFSNEFKCLSQCYYVEKESIDFGLKCRKKVNIRYKKTSPNGEV